MLNDAPAEVHILNLRCRGLTLRNAHVGNNLLSISVELLHQETTIYSYILHLLVVRRAHVDLQEAQVLLCAENLEGLVRERWSHDNLQEDGLHKLGYLLRNLAVNGYDATEDAHRISLVGLLPCLLDVLADSCATGVHVLETHSERLAELTHDVERSVSILDVVVRHLLAVELLSCSQRVGHLICRSVELCRLVGVLAIAQRLNEVERREELLVQLRLLTHICRDAHIVLCGVGISLCRELEACLEGCVATLLNLSDDASVVRRVAHNGYIAVVLSRRAQH